MDIINPFHLKGLNFHMNGYKDAYFSEGGIYQQYDVAKQAWVSQGTVINLQAVLNPTSVDRGAGTARFVPAPVGHR